MLADGDAVDRWEHRSGRDRYLGLAGLAVALIAIGFVVVMVAVSGSTWTFWNTVPVLPVLWTSTRLLRQRVSVDGSGVRIQGAIWSRLRPWHEVDGFRWGKSGQMAVAMNAGDLTPLPGVRIRGTEAERAERAEALCRQLEALRPDAANGGDRSTAIGSAR